MKILRNKYPCWALITSHALEQFIKRWYPNLTQDQAEKQLLYLLNGAKSVGHSRRNSSIYISGDNSKIRFVLNDKNICVTVLPKGNLSDLDAEIEEITRIS